MMHLDTHVVVWLYSGQSERFPAPASRLLEQERLVISPMVELELQFLFEIGRIDQPGKVFVEDLEQRIGLRIATTPFASVIEAARQLAWTRDPFDRLIAGQAVAEGARLLTADRTILAELDLAVWD